MPSERLMEPSPGASGSQFRPSDGVLGYDNKLKTVWSAAGDMANGEEPAVPKNRCKGLSGQEQVQAQVQASAGTGFFAQTNGVIRSCSSTNNMKIIYDPDTDRGSVNRGKKPIYRHDGGSNNGKRSTDPRKHSSYGPAQSRGRKLFLRKLEKLNYQFDENSVGQEPPSQVLVSCLSPLTTQEVIASYFKPYGDVSLYELQVHPSTGESLGLCKIQYRKVPKKPTIANISAKTAIEQTNGAKIGGRAIKVEFDPDWKKLDNSVKLAIEQLDKAREKFKPQKPEFPTTTNIGSARSLAPFDASKTHSGLRDGINPPSSPKVLAPMDSRGHHINEPRIKNNSILSETASAVIDTLARVGKKPYIFIANQDLSVRKVYNSDLRRHLARQDWSDIFHDEKGFYIVFDSIRAAERCLRQEDRTYLQCYRLRMELHEYRAIVRQPAQSKKAFRQTEVVSSTTTIILKELREVVMKDIKLRLITPLIFKVLSQARERSAVAALTSQDVNMIESQPFVANKTENAKSNAKKADDSETFPNLSSIDLNKLTCMPRFTKDIRRTAGTRKLKRADVRPMHQQLNEATDEESDQDAVRSSISERGAPSPFDSTAESDSSDGEANAFPTSGKDIPTPSLSAHVSESQGQIDDNTDDIDEFFIIDEKKIRKPCTTREAEFTSSDEEQPPIPTKTLEGPVKVRNRDRTKRISVKPKHVREVLQVQPDKPELSELLIFPPSEKSVDQLQSVELIEQEEDVLLDLDGIQWLVHDDDDFNYLLSAASEITPGDSIDPSEWAWLQKENKRKFENAQGPSIDWRKRKDYHKSNVTGTARSEGYVPIPETEKQHYLPDRNKAIVNISASATAKVSSRLNRVNNRRLAADIEMQKKSLSSESEVLRFNQLKTRKKELRFARSPIHDWGLFAMEHIDLHDMVIEYVGEVIRHQVAELREKRYEQQGIGSSYLFRVDEDTVIDATKSGNVARFINHCCTPNCSAKVIKVEGTKKIVIYANRDIDVGEEITYDYKFPIEAVKIACFCGSPGCRGTLN